MALGIVVASLGPRRSLLTHHQICRSQLNLLVTRDRLVTCWAQRAWEGIFL